MVCVPIADPAGPAILRGHGVGNGGRCRVVGEQLGRRQRGGVGRPLQVRPHVDDVPQIDGESHHADRRNHE